MIDYMAYYHKCLEYQQAKMQGLKLYKMLLKLYESDDPNDINRIKELNNEVIEHNKICIELKEELDTIRARNTMDIVKGE